MKPNEIYASLKTLAPSVCFFTELSPDDDFEWDGDGPNPEDEGYSPVNVDITATAIVNGEKVVGEASMGGHYVREDDFDPDFGGYLPQLLEEAADFLHDVLPVDHPARKETESVLRFLRQEMKDRYDAQQSGHQS